MLGRIKGQFKGLCLQEWLKSKAMGFSPVEGSGDVRALWFLKNKYIGTKGEIGLRG